MGHCLCDARAMHLFLHWLTKAEKKTTDRKHTFKLGGIKDTGKKQKQNIILTMAPVPPVVKVSMLQRVNNIAVHPYKMQTEAGREDVSLVS